MDRPSITPPASDHDSNGVQHVTTASQPGLCEVEEKQPTFIIGLDFGTTRTSVSYCRLERGLQHQDVPRESIKFITHWPGSGLQHQLRGDVPSESIYLNKNEYYWGYKASKEMEQLYSSGKKPQKSQRLIKFAKLLLENPNLDDQRGKNDFLWEVRETLSDLNKTVFEVIQDYLTGVFGHLKQCLIRDEGFHEGDETVEFSLSVPAGWPLEASWSLQQIVLEVGASVALGRISDLFLIHEPEAASVFSLDLLVPASEISVSARSPPCLFLVPRLSFFRKARHS